MRYFIADAIDFDGVFSATEFADMEQDTYMGKIVENAGRFSNSSTQILSTPTDAQHYLLRRGYLAAVFSASDPRMKDQNAKGIFSIIAILPNTESMDRHSESGIFEPQKKIYFALLQERIRYWFERFDNHTSIQERLKLMFQNLLNETGRLNPEHSHYIAESLKQSDPRIVPIRIFLGYAEASNASTEEYDDVYRIVVGRHEAMEMVVGPLSNREKLLFARLKIIIHRPRPFHDMLVDHLFALRDSDPAISEFFDDEGLIGKLFYDSSKRKYAIYQLDRKHGVADIDGAFREGRISPPEVEQERRIVSEIQATIDRQFPQASYVKNGVLSYAEESIRTSRAETRRLDASRLNLDNWHESPELVAIDMPDFVNSRMQSSFDRQQLLEYLVGTRSEQPELIGRNNSQDDAAQYTATLADFRTRFAQSPLWSEP